MNTVRCVLGMLGTDAHTKGIRTLSRIFRDAGVEVVYLGEHNTYEQFAASVAAEDADLAGVSFSTAGYVKHVDALMRALDEAGVDDVPVMVGGLIHADDEPRLRELGVSGIFGPGSTTESILDFVFSSARSNTEVRSDTEVQTDAHDPTTGRLVKSQDQV
ncbi:MAG TPA: cobalamin-dependent protein [Pseudonocardia sp.]|jgi:methylmalonyl-CoA mutase C-terminal domain/subunit|nr:cobalamin-dependent protein [Pseudonocardia sp.]